MKKILLIASLLPLAGLLGFTVARSHFSDKVDVRTGQWPIFIERVYGQKGVNYLLQFRDQGSIRAVVMDTVVLATQRDLKYLDEALVSLKKGHSGDVASFDNFSVGRADKPGKVIWYTLKDNLGVTDFQQPEADIISKAANGW